MDNGVVDKIQAATRKYDNFPKPGVQFIDIYPIVSDPSVFALVIDTFAKQL